MPVHFLAKKVSAVATTVAFASWGLLGVPTPAAAKYKPRLSISTDSRGTTATSVRTSSRRFLTKSRCSTRCGTAPAKHSTFGAGPQAGYSQAAASITQASDRTSTRPLQPSAQRSRPIRIGNTRGSPSTCRSRTETVIARSERPSSTVFTTTARTGRPFTTTPRPVHPFTASQRVRQRLTKCVPQAGYQKATAERSPLRASPRPRPRASGFVATSDTGRVSSCSSHSFALGSC